MSRAIVTSARRPICHSLLTGLMIALVWAPARASAPVFVSGPINKETVWSDEIHLTGDVTIPAGARLTILPGTIVIGEPRANDQLGGDDPNRTEIIVDGGLLDVEGTEDSPILFTSSADAPGPGDWAGIADRSGTSTLAYGTVEYGSVGLLLNDPASTVQHSTFRQAGGCGVEVDVPATLSDSSIESNAQGVCLAPGQTVHLSRCTILGTGGVAAGVTATSSKGSGTIASTVVKGGANGGRGDGAAVFGRNGAAIVIDGSVIGDNSGNSILYVSSGALTLSDTVVGGNVSGAGIIYGDGASTVNLTASKVTDNTGSAAVYAPTVNVSGSAIDDNSGYGIYLTDAGSKVAGSSITDNQGGGICSA